jgi:RNA polymerase sigma-70 factor, ECF subfamily
VSTDRSGGLRPQPGTALLALYDSALPLVHGYLLSRCGDRATAEDLTSEVFLAAVAAQDEVGVPWLIGTARHKLVDHWRRRERELRLLDDPSQDEVHDPWEVELDALRARDVLAGLGPHHRAALVLRHVDGLPVPEVAAHLGRTLHATEALLVRARRAFRSAYEEGCRG